jgi:transcriptional regulator with XRE-family HTH domain
MTNRFKKILKDVETDYAWKLKMLRIRLKLTQSEMAEKLGFKSFVSISRFENRNKDFPMTERTKRMIDQLRQEDIDKKKTQGENNNG